jgi:hypothetical protein
MSLKTTWTFEGEGKGGGRTPTEAPDSLFSNSTGHIVDLISEGEIEGLVDGDKTLYYSEVQWLADDGVTRNFKGVTVAANWGLDDQPALTGFDDVRTSVPVDQDLPYNTYKTISFPNDGTFTAVDITIQTDSFFEVNKDGDTHGTSVTFVIEKSENGAGFTSVVSGTISGKQKDTYDVDYRVQVSDTGGNTAIRVKRTKADATSLKVNDKITFKLYTKIVEHKLAYPNRAVIGHVFDAKQFGNQLPARAGKYRGIKCYVPSNYNPVTRTYTGTFTGALSASRIYTNNPAWVFYDLVTSKRYGLGQYFDSTLIDIPSLYTIGKWCDDMVADGISLTQTVTSITRSGSTATATRTAHGYSTGDFIKIAGAAQPEYNGDFYVTVTGANTFTYTVTGTPATPATGTITAQKREPRWVCNTYITNRDDAFNVLKDLVTCFRGVLFWMDGKLWAQADLPRTPVKLVTNANVIDGVFTYSGESNRSRNSVANVAYNDPNLFYRRAIETYEDPDLIRELGWKPTDVQGVGCTSRAQARRLAKAILYSQEFESELVTYRASFDHMAVEGDGPMGVAPGDVVLIADHERGNAVGGGRVVTATTSTFVGVQDLTECDWGSGTGSVYLEHAATGTVEYVACTFNGSTATVTLTASPVEPLAVNDLYIIIEAGFDPEPFRVIKISETEPNIVEVAAARYDDGKFAAIYGEFQFDSENIMRVGNGQFIAAPSSISVIENYVYNVDFNSRTLEVSWTPVDDTYLDYYVVTWGKDNDASTRVISGSSAIRIENVRPGIYDIQVQAVNRLGIYSLATEITYTVLLTPSDLAVGYITDLQILPDTTLINSDATVIDDDTTAIIDDTDGATIIDGGSGVTTLGFIGRDPLFKWTVVSPTATYLTDSGGVVPNSGFTDPKFRDCLVRIKRIGGELLREEGVVDTFYTYTYEKNYIDTVSDPVRTFIIEVSYRDIYGRVSDPVVAAVVNAAPNLATPTATVALNQLSLVYDPPSDPDFVGIIVWMSTTTGFTPNDATKVWKAPGNAVVPINQNTAYFYRYGFYDAFGESGIIISSEQTITTSASSIVVTGPASANVFYDNTGATIQAEVDLSFSISVNGVALTSSSGVTFTYTVIDGMVNGFGSTSGQQTITPTNGVGVLAITGMTSNSATVQIKATYNSAPATSTSVSLTRILGSATSTGGSTPSQTTGFATLNSASFVAISNVLTIAVPAGKTATSTSINLTCKWSPRTGQTSFGSWNLRFKLQRSAVGAGVWSDIGSTFDSNPDPRIDTDSDSGFTTYFSIAGTISATISDTVSASTSYDYQLVGEIQSGSTSGNSGGIIFIAPTGGGITITCP